MRTVLLVHGMGQITAKEFRKRFVDAAIKSLQLYDLNAKWDADSEQFGINYEGAKWEKTRVVSFGYNDFFESRRIAIGDQSRSIAERLQSVGMADIPVPGLLTKINNLSLKFGEDKFFQTHFGDVLMYALTTVGEQVRVSLASMITGLIETGTAPGDIQIVAHSLGTSVVHDTLSKLSAENEDREDSQLNIVTHRLGGVHMFANVSNILDFYIPTLESSVKPGKGGCISYYNQYNNKLDPFTRVSPFRPANNKKWVTKTVYRNNYMAIDTNDVTGGNVHGFGHYLLDPKNSSWFFGDAFNVDLRLVRSVADEAYGQLTLSNAAKEAKDALKNIDIKNEKSLKNLEKALKALSAFAKKIGSDLEF